MNTLKNIALSALLLFSQLPAFALVNIDVQGTSTRIKDKLKSGHSETYVLANFNVEGLYTVAIDPDQDIVLASLTKCVEEGYKRPEPYGENGFAVDISHNEAIGGQFVTVMVINLSANTKSFELDVWLNGVYDMREVIVNAPDEVNFAGGTQVMTTSEIDDQIKAKYGREGGDKKKRLSWGQKTKKRLSWSKSNKKGDKKSKK